VCGWEQNSQDSMLSISPKDEDDSIKVVLLKDIKEVFDNRLVDSMYSEDLVNALVELNDRPWAEWRRGKQLTTNSLARLLKPFKIRPKQIRRHTTNKNGYEFSAFKETFKRYLPPTPDPTSTTLPASTGNSFSDIQTSTVTKEVGVEKQLEPAPVKGSRGVEVENRGIGVSEGMAHEKTQEVTVLIESILDELGKPISVDMVLNEIAPDDYQCLIDDISYTKDYIIKELLPRLAP